jgi:hypothetical protein
LIGDPLLRRTRALLAGRLDRIAPPGPVLDVGAGEAVLIDGLRRRGREAVGLERNSRHKDVRDDPLERVEGSGQRSSSGTRSSTFRIPAGRFAKLPACCGRAGSP